MEYEVNRLRTFYLLPNFLFITSEKKQKLASIGFFLDLSSRKAVCYFCESSTNIKNSIVSITNQHHMCRINNSKPDYHIPSPFTAVEEKFPMNALFEEFRIATFAKYNPEISIDNFRKENLAKKGFYFYEVSHTLKCAFCNTSIINATRLDVKNHIGNSNNCLMKKELMLNKIRNLDLDFFKRNRETSLYFLSAAANERKHGGLSVKYEEKPSTSAMSDAMEKEVLHMKKMKDAMDLITCKICMDRQLCIIFKPCHHAITCLNCSLLLLQCPMCRKKIISKNEIHF